MPKLSQHHASSVVKILYLGDSGTGKTGSLVSLVKAGYKLHVLDLDNGLDVLLAYVKKECPELIDNVDYETRRDLYKATPLGPTVAGIPKAYVQSLGLMTKWSDDTIPSAWGKDHVFVIDSLTGLGRAAFEWAKGMSPNAKEPRQWYHQAQQAVEACLGLMMSESFTANVIVIAHVHLQKDAVGSLKAVPNSIGQAIGPIIPTYFNTMVLATSGGVGTNVKRSIETAPTALLDLKNPVPFKIDAKYDLGTGLATIFSTLKDQSK